MTYQVFTAHATGQDQTLVREFTDRAEAIAYVREHTVDVLSGDEGEIAMGNVSDKPDCRVMWAE